MDIDSIPRFNSGKQIKTYPKAKKKSPIVKQNVSTQQLPIKVEIKRQPLTSRNAITYLLEGTLKSKICRYCLDETPILSELEQILQIATHRGIYKVTIKDIIASFYPVQASTDKNLPNKICNKCLTSALSSYLFTQQCEQAERALRNYFEDFYEKLERLDPLERPRKRGRQKLHPNHNKIHVEHQNVMDYAEPLINLVNIGSEPLTKEDKLQDYECLKCCEVLPNVAALLNHENKHPKTMWYHCRLCARAFPKRHQLKKHFGTHSKDKIAIPDSKLTCNHCNFYTEEYNKYLQHLEKHKFKELLQNLTNGGMRSLCAICLNKKSGLNDMEKMICLQGGCPELSGDMTLYNIVSSTIPEMHTRDNYTGTKICEKCLDQAIVAYVFTNQFYFIRNRLNTFINSLSKSLNNVDITKGNVFAEIPDSMILPIPKNTNYFMFESEIDERKLNIDVLEDEFREPIDIEDTEEINRKNIDNSSSKLVNGYQNVDQSISEFLTFNKHKIKRKETHVCFICFKKFISNYFLKKHLKKHIQKCLKCEVCALVCQSKFEYYEHIENAHTSNRKMKCTTCLRYIDLNKISAHNKSHKTPQCVICAKTFKSFKDFNIHVKRHSYRLRSTKLKKMICSFCDKKFLTNKSLLLHVNKIHLELKPYDCDMCEKQFYSENNLKCHKKLHNLKTLEQCELCNKNIMSRRKLTIHIRKHLNDTPYSCEVCYQKFYSEDETYKHMRKQHGGKFICAFCKTVCETKKKLKNHVNTSHFQIV